MAKYIKLTEAQKEEIRRLAQFANRRIRAAHEEFKKQNLDITPTEVTGRHQIKQQWHAEKTPISRGVLFTSQEEYKRQIEYLRSFERTRPTIKQFARIEREKTINAIETTIGDNIPQELRDKINSMNAAELDIFWRDFDERAKRKGIQYSSEAVMVETLNEVLDEDIEHLTG